MKRSLDKVARGSQPAPEPSPAEAAEQPRPSTQFVDTRPSAGHPPSVGTRAGARLPDELIWDVAGVPEPPAAATASLGKPPTLLHPELGQAVPVPDPDNTCPHCGSSRACWVYRRHAPGSRRGWVLQRRLICCAAAERLALLGLTHRPAVLILSQPDLDRIFVQRSVRAQTFLTYDPDAQPGMAGIYRAVLGYARQFDPDRSRGGVFIAGPAGIGKSHLIHALVNQARALGLPALSLPLAQLLDLTRPDPFETPEGRQERHDRRRILRQVPVLAIRDLDQRPLSAAEIQELALLLEYREERQLLTHFTGTQTPAQYRQQPQPAGDPEAVAGLTRCIERLCALILTCDQGRG